MNSEKIEVQHKQSKSGLVIPLAVLATCILVSAIVWIPFSFAALVIGGILHCSSAENGALARYTCAGKSAVINLVLPICSALGLFLVCRQAGQKIARYLRQLPGKSHPFIGPALATFFFAAFWSWIHYATPFAIGVLPQIIFPAIVGIWTYVISQTRKSRGVPMNSTPPDGLRNRIRRPIRLGLVAAGTMLLAWGLGHQQLISSFALQQQIVVLTGLALAYWIVSPPQSAESSLGAADTGMSFIGAGDAR